MLWNSRILELRPLFVQVFHNNMTDGISEISFTYDAGNFYVSFTEGEVIHKASCWIWKGCGWLC